MHNIGIGVYGEWRYWITTKNGVVKNYRDWNKNIILNSAIYYPLRGAALLRADYTIQLGDGDSTPSVTQTGLDNVVYETQSSNVKDLDYSDRAHLKMTYSRTIPSGTGDLTIRELSLRNKLSLSPWSYAVNRILITDINGDPSEIVKLDGDTMTVECRISIKRLSETPVDSGVISDGLGGTIQAHTLLTDYGLYDIFCGAGNIQLLSGLVSIGTGQTSPSPSDVGCETVIEEEAATWSDISITDVAVTKSVDISSVVSSLEKTFREVCVGCTAISGQYPIRTVFSRDYVKPAGKTVILTYKLEFFR